MNQFDFAINISKLLFVQLYDVKTREVSDIGQQMLYLLTNGGQTFLPERTTNIRCYQPIAVNVTHSHSDRTFHVGQYSNIHISTA